MGCREQARPLNRRGGRIRAEEQLYRLLMKGLSLARSTLRPRALSSACRPLTRDSGFDRR